MNTKRCLIVVVLFLLAGCGSVQGTIQQRETVLGQRSVSSNFAEAKQISDIENWKDDSGKIVFWYVNFPPGSDSILVLQCRGVPASSTESLEPNEGGPSSSLESTWLVPIDGIDTRTREMAGRDGTFGDPVHFRQCMTVDGQYIDIPAYGVPYLTSSGIYSFPPSTVKRDFETEARLLAAESIIRAGGCVSPETLEEIECPKENQ